MQGFQRPIIWFSEILNQIIINMRNINWQAEPSTHCRPQSHCRELSAHARRTRPVSPCGPLTGRQGTQPLFITLEPRWALLRTEKPTALLRWWRPRGTSPRGGTSTFVASSFLRSVSATERLLVYLSVLNQIQGKQDYQIVWCKCNFTKSYGCSVPETKCWEFGLRCLSRVWALIFTSLSAAR